MIFWIREMQAVQMIVDCSIRRKRRSDQRNVSFSLLNCEAHN